MISTVFRGADITDGIIQTRASSGFYLPFKARSSIPRPGTRSNCRTLFFTSTALTAMECPTIAVSFGPAGVCTGWMAPGRAQNPSTGSCMAGPYSRAACDSPARLISKNTMRWLRSTAAETSQYGFRLFAKNERADVFI